MANSLMRPMTSVMDTQLKSDQVRPIIFLYGDFPSGPVRLWNGIGNITWDGNVYNGGGTLLEISEIRETTQVNAEGLSVTLSGIPSDMISLALGEHYQSRTAKVWLGALNDAGDIIGSPVLLFTGKMDTMRINRTGETASITLNVENELVSLKRPRERRYTHEDQKAKYPQDKGLEFVASLQDKEITWGR